MGETRVVSRGGLKSGSGLPGAVDAIIEGRKLFDTDGPARMQPPGGDADLRAKAELAAVGELCRGVMQHDGGIDLAQKPVGRGSILGQDRVGMVRTVRLDMGDRA